MDLRESKWKKLEKKTYITRTSLKKTGPNFLNHFSYFDA